MNRLRDLHFFLIITSLSRSIDSYSVTDAGLGLCKLKRDIIMLIAEVACWSGESVDPSRRGSGVFRNWTRGGHMRGLGSGGGSPPEAERILKFKVNPVYIGPISPISACPISA